jgi:hypothetical protein
MRVPHNAEGHLLSLGSPLDGLPVGGLRGSGYRRQRILAMSGVDVDRLMLRTYLSHRLNVTFQCVVLEREQARV